MDFVYEEDVAGLEGGEECGDVSGALQCGAGGGVEAAAHFAGDDDGEGGFAKSGGSEEEGVVQGFAALFCGGDEDGELASDFGLSDVLGEGRGAETGF